MGTSLVSRGPWAVRVLFLWCAISSSALAQSSTETTELEELTALVERAESSDRTAIERLEDAGAALSLVARLGDEALQARALIARSDALQQTGRYDEARADADRARSLQVTRTNPQLLADAYYQIAVALYRQAELHDALDHARTARSSYRRQARTAKEAKSLALIGAIHRKLFDSEASLRAHADGLRLSESIGDELGVARALNNIALLYWHTDRLTEAEEDLKRALAIFEQAGRKSATSTALSNLGLILVAQDRPEDALGYLHRARPIYEEMKDRAGISKVVSNIAYAHDKMGDSDTALELYRESLAIREQIGDRHGILRAQANIAEVLTRTNDHEAALALVDEALRSAEEVGAINEKRWLLRSQSVNREALGNVQSALDSYRSFHDLDAELNSAATQHRFDLIDAQLRRSREFTRSKELQAENEAQSAELSRQRLWQRLLIIGSVTLAFFSVLLLILHRLRNRALRALRDSHDELHDTTNRLAESEQRYRALFQESVVPTILIDTPRRAVVDWNEPARRLCQIEDHSSPSAVDTIEPRWLREAVARIFDEQATDEVAVDDCFVDPAGQLRWTEVRGSTVFVDGRACKLVSFRDTTESQSVVEAQVRADRLESLGVMAGGIAHDFNNALTAIIGHVAMARETEDREATESLRLAQQSAVQASQLTSQLLAFAKGGLPNRRPHDIRKLLTEAVELSSSGSGLRIEIDVPKELHCANVDAANSPRSSATWS
ncbi:MAG: tetratricopeptide repeat protein [Planctomycetota bacterium]